MRGKLTKFKKNEFKFCKSVSGNRLLCFVFKIFLINPKK